MHWIFFLCQSMALFLIKVTCYWAWTRHKYLSNLFIIHQNIPIGSFLCMQLIPGSSRLSRKGWERESEDYHHKVISIRSGKCDTNIHVLNLCYDDALCGINLSRWWYCLVFKNVLVCLFFCKYFTDILSIIFLWVRCTC